MSESENILDHPGVLQILFHPRRDHGYPAGENLVSLEVEPEVAVGGRLYIASPEAPVILYYHGNGEIAADYEDIARMYRQIDVSLLVMDYRGYGTSSGTPTGSNLVSDGMAVFNQLDQVFASHNLNPTRLYVMGRSLGSVPAVEIARQAGEKLAGLIIESGFSDTFGLLERLGVRVDGASEEADGFGNAIKMREVQLPTLILHGQRDILIPATDGQELHDQCAAENKHLVLIPGAGHNDIMLVGMSRYFQALQMFIAG